MDEDIERIAAFKDQINPKYYKNELDQFYTNLIIQLQKIDSARKKTGAFRRALITLFEDVGVDPNNIIKKTNDLKLDINPAYSSIVKTKIADLQIETPPIGTYFIEIKYSLSIDSLGSALMEGILLKRNIREDNFVVISLYEKRSAVEGQNEVDYFNAICKQDPINRYINGVVCFGPEYDGGKMENVVNLLNALLHRRRGAPEPDYVDITCPECGIDHALQSPKPMQINFKCKKCGHNLHSEYERMCRLHDSNVENDD